MEETLGQKLKQARQARRLTLEQASEATHIRLHYLQGLEAGDYSVMSSAAQARGFLRNYCSFLALDLDEMLAALQESHGAAEIHGPLQQVDIAPPPPESAAASRPTRPVSTALTEKPKPPAHWRERLKQLTRRSEKAAGVTKQPEVVSLPPGVEDQPAAPAVVEAQELPGGSDSSLIQEEPRAVAAPPPTPLWTDRLKVLLAAREQSEGSTDQPVSSQDAMNQSASASGEPFAQPPGSAESAEAIFFGIGRDLRRRRELLSLTPEEVERHIHIKAEFIVALEQGDLSRLPSAVQTRGMLANYSDFLDLDTDALLLRFADSLQASHRVRYPKAPGSARQPVAVKPKLPPLRSFMATDVIFGLAVVVMVVALIAWGLGRVFQEQAAPLALPTAPSISDVLAGTSAPPLNQQVTLIPVDDTPLSPVESTLAPEATEEAVAFDPAVPVSLTVVATERTFMRVLVDGKEIFNGRVTPGVAYSYAATTTIQILTGNGAALRVTYNGRDLGLLGNFGQVVEFIYTANEIVTPIPVSSPTPTASPFLSPTPSPTPSRTPTVTRTPTTAAP
jgi:cytoskeletal protein RodZ